MEKIKWPEIINNVVFERTGEKGALLNDIMRGK